MKLLRSLMVFGSALAFSINGHAAMLTFDLGNTASGLAPGDTPSILELVGIQGGQAAPFDAGKGNDLFPGQIFDETWTHSFGAIADPILAATITIGLVDHDSAASGSQLSSFLVDGSDQTSLLNTVMEALPAGDGVYQAFTINLGAGLFAGLADGDVEVTLALAGPGLITPLLGGGGAQESAGNGAHLIFSTLTIMTEDTPPPPPPPPTGVPEPATWLLMLLGGLMLVGRKVITTVR